MLKKFILDSIRNLKSKRNDRLKQKRLRSYFKGNRIPWSEGYDDFKWQEIMKSIHSPATLELFRSGESLPAGYGVGLDERIVEYPFVFSRLKNDKSVFLDAGSTFNYESIVEHSVLREKELNIYTYFPESWNFVGKRISYQFGDLRALPYRNDWFDEIACISTIEHIGMDNTLYGYKETRNSAGPDASAGYLTVIKELLRVLKPGGSLFLTFPFGRKISYGFFQQFNSEMTGGIRSILDPAGKAESMYFKYTPKGWIISNEESCADSDSYNPHTGEGKGNDGAAHSRAVCALHFIKNK